MATAIFGKGAAYDVMPTGEHAGLLSGPLGGLFGFCKDTAQGACSGLLSLIGATHMTGAPSGFASLNSNIGPLNNIWESVSAGGLAGPVELLAGVALFLAARRTIARTLGLLLFIGLIAAYANGYSLADMLTALTGVVKSAAGVIEAAQAAQSA